MHHIHDEARVNNWKASNKQKQHYNKHCSESNLNVGSQVLFYRPKKTVGKPETSDILGGAVCSKRAVERCAVQHRINAL